MTRKQKQERSEYNRLLNNRLAGIHSHIRISLRTPKVESEKIFTEHLLNAIVKIIVETKAYSHEKSMWIALRLEYLAFEITTTHDLIGCYEVFKEIRRDWRKIKRTLES